MFPIFITRKVRNCINKLNTVLLNAQVIDCYLKIKQSKNNLTQQNLNGQ